MSNKPEKHQDLGKVSKKCQGIVRINKYGGFYEQGRKYQLRDKRRVQMIYNKAVEDAFPLEPSLTKVAQAAKVSRHFVSNVLKELEENSRILDPSDARNPTQSTGVCGFLEIEQELFLLGLQADNPSRMNSDYCHQLFNTFGLSISLSSVSNFFLKWFDKKGNFKKANLVPLDKWKVGNRARYFEFMYKVNKLKDHTRCVFFDEKHLVNKDTLPGMVRANPLTGYVDAISVSGDFRDSFNMLAAVSCSVSKGRPTMYSIGRENGMAVSFMSFVRKLIISGWLHHSDVVCLDNARIHTGGEACVLESLLWGCVKDGQPLRILTVFLPTQSPELNPIELVFHILATKMHKKRLRNGQGPCHNEVVKYASAVMDEINFYTVAKCYVHCGY